MKVSYKTIIKTGMVLLLVTGLKAQGGEDDFAVNFAEDISNKGTSSAAFLEIGVGARAQALGGAFTALANDASALYWNPAGLTQLSSITVAMHHTEWLADTKFEYFGAIIPMGNSMTFGLTLSVLDYVDKQPVRTIGQPEGTGEFYSASDLSLGSTFAMSLTDRFSFGISFKYIRQEVWHELAEGFAMDLGVLYKTGIKGLSLGTSMSNFGTDLQLNGRDLTRPFDDDPLNYSNDKLNTNLKTDTFPLPLLFRFGIAYGFEFNEHNSVTTLVDLNHPSNNVESMNMGIEYNFYDFFALRGDRKSVV